MSLADFQRAFARAVAAPSTWSTALGGLQLTAREIERLRGLLNHERLRANLVMLRSTRAMPLHSALPLTCDWLQHETPAAFDAWFADAADASVQYGRETDRFAAWLPAYLARTGSAVHAALDALCFERALATLASQFAAGQPATTIVLSWRYAPRDILGGWRAGVGPLAVQQSTRLCVRDGAVILEPDR